MIEETGAADRVLFSKKAEKWFLSIAEQRPSLDRGGRINLIVRLMGLSKN